MQQNLINEQQMKNLEAVTFLVGNRERLADVGNVKALVPFDEHALDFLDALSKKLMSNVQAKQYPDVVTLGFWIRKASMLKIKERFVKESNDISLGRGIAFHIAPSNVPVNYAYSLIAGLITGNVNIVRISSKDFPQVELINSAINATLEHFPFMKDYIYLTKYNRNQNVNDVFSAIADVRIIWGGDNTIEELRKSPLSPRAGEVTFADRYSLAIINSEKYLAIENKTRFAEEFYNDTFLTDQNACTSPRIVVWTGKQKSDAKNEFWEKLHELTEKKYQFQSIMGVNKLTSSYVMAATHEGVNIEAHEDNLIVRVRLDSVDDSIMELKDNSGYFFEYDCDNLMEIRDLCNNIRCQTVGYLGEKEDILSLIASGIKGIDRVVPIGKTMDFDLIWDGYNLFERLTRTVNILI